MTTDHSLAAELASAAGDLLVTLRARLGFADAASLRDSGDRESHLFLMAALAEHRPHDAVLSEEGEDQLQRLRADRVWIVDPLDGTREFGEEGRTDWAVHVALWTRERGLAAGAVALPALGVTLSTTDTGAVEEDGTDRRPLHPATPTTMRIAVSRSRPPEFVSKLAGYGLPEVRQVPLGSAGAKVAAVLLGEQVDAYIHAGGQHEWDSAAPVAVALAAGMHASRIDGAPLAYNQKDTNLPDILVCHRESAPALLAAIRDARKA